MDLKIEVYTAKAQLSKCLWGGKKTCTTTGHAAVYLKHLVRWLRLETTAPYKPLHPLCSSFNAHEHICNISKILLTYASTPQLFIKRRVHPKNILLTIDYRVISISYDWLAVKLQESKKQQQKNIKLQFYHSIGLNRNRLEFNPLFSDNLRPLSC